MREDVAKQRMVGEVAAALGPLGELGQHGAVAVEQHGARAGPRLDQAGQAADPLQVDRRHDDGVDRRVLAHGRIGGDHGRLVGRALDQVVAEHEAPAAARLLHVRAVAEIEPDRVGPGRADDAVVRADHRQGADPRHVDREAGEEVGAALAGAGERDVAARHHLEHGAGRVDHLELGGGAALGELERLVRRHLGALGPARLEQAHAVERERHHGEQREQHQARPDAQARGRALARAAIGHNVAMHAYATPRPGT